MSSRILTTFINRQTGTVYGQSGLSDDPGGVLSDRTRTALQANSSGKTPRLSVPPPTSLVYNTDINTFTDVFSLEIDLAPDDLFDIQSHDFVEFYFELDNPAPGYQKRHQIGVGFLEKFHRDSSPTRVKIMANGRDLFGENMFAPFVVPVRQNLTLKDFLTSKVIKGSYLEAYHSIRGQGRSTLVDRGAFGTQMFFRSDLEQKKGALIQNYAGLAINVVFMNRLGQVEILGRPGTLGSTAPSVSSSPLGILKKGSNVDRLIVKQDYTNVFSDFTVFWTSAQAEQSKNTLASNTFKNSDPRVSHISKPGFLTLNTSDLASLGGEVSASQRISDLAKSNIRKSNQNLNSAVVMTSDPFFTKDDGTQVPFIQGQVWRLQSNEPEFKTRAQPTGTDSVDMLLSGINYNESLSGQEFQLNFIEGDTLI